MLYLYKSSEYYRCEPSGNLTMLVVDILSSFTYAIDKLFSVWSYALRAPSLFHSGTGYG